jgi:pimeloyl-ACP methyl ester carboxylesterase
MNEPLVLLPGMNCSSRLWAGVETALGNEVPELVVRHGSLDCDTVDGCVDALLSALPPRFALAGLSLGGIIAMALLRRAPERVAGLCLMSTNARAPTNDQRIAWETQQRELAAGRSARDLQRELLPVLVSPAARTAELEPEVLRMADETGSVVLGRQLRAQATRIDERPFLRRIGVPTLVLAGADDALCPVSRHEEMHRLVPAARLVVLEGAGHLSPLEAPDLVAGHLLDWLSPPWLSPERAGRGRPPSVPV